MYIVPLSHLPSITPLEQTQKTTPAAAAGSSVPVFGDILKDAMQNMQETQAASKQDSYNLALGNTDDLHTIQINSMKASAAVELTAGLTSRAINAYKEILQTQL